jgi:hypothetical protein
MACGACYIYYLVNLQYTILHPPQLIPLIDGVLDEDVYRCGGLPAPLCACWMGPGRVMTKEMKVGSVLILCIVYALLHC